MKPVRWLCAGVAACAVLVQGQVLAAGVGGAGGAPADDDGGSSPEALAAAADAVAPSLVLVEYTLRYDKGEAPAPRQGGSWQRAVAAAVHSEASDDSDYEGLIRDERPLVRPGYLLADGRVVTRDTRIHPRFIASIAVRQGSASAAAETEGYARQQDAVFLRVRQGLPGGRPLAFDAKARGAHAVGYTLRSGAWTIGVGAVPSGARTEPGGSRRYTPAPPEVLVLSEKGAAVGLSFTGELALDGSWKGDPGAWASVREAEMAGLVRELDRAGAAALPRVEVRFRSPRGTAGGEGNRRFRSFRQEDGEDQTTEWNGTGVLVDPTTVVVLADFKPKLTARIESVTVHGADDTPAVASFAGTLKDYKGFVATLKSPMPGPARLSSAAPSSLRGTLLLKAEVSVLGEVRTAYCWHDRIDSFSLGWKNRVYPDSEAVRGGSRPWETESVTALNFLFDLSGALVAAPLGHRERVSSGQERFGADETSDAMLPAAYLADVIGQGAGAYDAENRPLSEDEENRLAWLGVELQAMDPDLARVNRVVDQTGGGRTGAVVTYLYPDSPAAAAGIEVGDIILRLHVQGQPKPLEVELQPTGMEGMMDQFWAMYDRLPDEYFDQIPQPWGSAENTLTRALTDVGFGTPFTVDVFRGGKVETRDMRVTQGPAHYNAARRFKSEPAGMTVRDITYEVRRYFQLRPDDPGVIISKIEKGGRASVAGLKPYEIITSVNDAPVRSVADIEQALAAGGELRLSVKRMTEGRIVKLKVSAPQEKRPDDEGPK